MSFLPAPFRNELLAAESFIWTPGSTSTQRSPCQFHRQRVSQCWSLGFREGLVVAMELLIMIAARTSIPHTPNLQYKIT